MLTEFSFQLLDFRFDEPSALGNVGLQTGNEITGSNGSFKVDSVGVEVRI